MIYSLLTVDRGDRPKMYNHCLKQVAGLEGDYWSHIRITHPPESKGADLKDRVKKGYELAVEQGIDWIVVIESDDFYSNDYLSQFTVHMSHADFIGCEYSYYYNLQNKTWEKLNHSNRSSLFTTAFRVSAMKDFNWSQANKLFLDIDIWRYARRFRRSFIQTNAIGIKGHGEGMVGGKGHVMRFRNLDPDMVWLKNHTDQQSFEFYKSLV
jgi:hypothetical protein